MLFKNSVRTSERTPHFTITKINWLTLFKFNSSSTSWRRDTTWLGGTSLYSVWRKSEWRIAGQLLASEGGFKLLPVSFEFDAYCAKPPLETLCSCYCIKASFFTLLPFIFFFLSSFLCYVSNPCKYVVSKEKNGVKNLVFRRGLLYCVES
jgi:hypothetical protein